MQKDDFNNWYKDQLDSLNAEPPDRVWENISGQLDTDKVWTSISKTLDRKDRRRKHRGVVLVLFLLFGSAYIVLHNYGRITPDNTGNNLHDNSSPVEQRTLPDNEKSAVTDNQIPVTANNSGNAINTNSGSLLPASDDRTIADQTVPAQLMSEPNNRQLRVSPQNQEPSVNDATGSLGSRDYEFNPIASVPIKLPVAHNQESQLLRLELLEIPFDTATTPRATFFTTGISCVGSFSGLIDQHYIRSLKKNTTNSVSIAPDISGELFAEKITRNNFGFGGFINFNSTIAQTYHGYYEGQFLNNVVRLQTFRAGAYFAWYWDRKTTSAFGPENCLVAGLTGNLITRKYYYGIAGEYYNPENLVNIYPGVMLGLRKYKSVLPGLFVHAGFNCEISLTNVYGGEPGIPKDFFRTHIVTTNVTAGISYRFINQH